MLHNLLWLQSQLPLPKLLKGVIALPTITSRNNTQENLVMQGIVALAVAGHLPRKWHLLYLRRPPLRPHSVFDLRILSWNVRVLLVCPAFGSSKRPYLAAGYLILTKSP